MERIDDACKACSPVAEQYEADAKILQTRLLAHTELKKLVHSIKWRTKDPGHLHDKLIRKAESAIKEGSTFYFDAQNIFERLPDLACVRQKQQHKQQIEQI